MTGGGGVLAGFGLRDDHAAPVAIGAPRIGAGVVALAIGLYRLPLPSHSETLSPAVLFIAVVSIFRMASTGAARDGRDASADVSEIERDANDQSDAECAGDEWRQEDGLDRRLSPSVPQGSCSRGDVEVACHALSSVADGGPSSEDSASAPVSAGVIFRSQGPFLRWMHVCQTTSRFVGTILSRCPRVALASSLGCVLGASGTAQARRNSFDI